jgi:hypothetical protein
MMIAMPAMEPIQDNFVAHMIGIAINKIYPEANPSSLFDFTFFHSFRKLIFEEAAPDAIRFVKSNILGER